MSDEKQEEKIEFVSEKLASARERLAAAEKALAEKRAAEKLAVDEQEAIDKAALAEAELKHGDVGDGIARIGTKMGCVIVRRPTEARWRQAAKEAESRQTEKLEESAKRLVLDHLVHPTSKEYFAIAECYPKLPGILVDMISNLAGGGARALSGE